DLVAAHVEEVHETPRRGGELGLPRHGNGSQAEGEERSDENLSGCLLHRPTSFRVLQHPVLLTQGAINVFAGTRICDKNETFGGREEASCAASAGRAILCAAPGKLGFRRRQEGRHMPSPVIRLYRVLIEEYESQGLTPPFPRDEFEARRERYAAE